MTTAHATPAAAFEAALVNALTVDTPAAYASLEAMEAALLSEGAITPADVQAAIERARGTKSAAALKEEAALTARKAHAKRIADAHMGEREMLAALYAAGYHPRKLSHDQQTRPGSLTADAQIVGHNYYILA